MKTLKQIEKEKLELENAFYYMMYHREKVQK